ncbi:LytR/AlgR family response regulator transcription factor [Clostridium perfringens]|uniref:LytR/AlgR family response regulator transcription factor n=1 Tax=Clostridium perfringens TaxID=1502 RepID=UPI0013E33FAC|nr:LytTR family DNA-binding domain-containing protein [Clostridium perfringens]NGT36040.1 response regulator transcription factor [Clostridium perfringens]
MFSIALCEDNSLQREELKNNLSKVLDEIGVEYKLLTFETGEDLLREYPENLDMLFLDIQMGELTGMETARKVRKYDDKVEIIFITALWDYIQKGYEVRAFRYLIKPVKFKELQEQVTACVENILHKRYTYITIKDKNNVLKIRTEDILFLETFERKVIIHTNSQDYIVKMSMNKLEKALNNKGFFRCHTSYIVDLIKIEEIKKDYLLINKFTLPVSKHRMKNLKLRLTSLLGDLIC